MKEPEQAAAYPRCAEERRRSLLSQLMGISGVRLSYIVPLAPWPVLMWLNSFEGYIQGRHPVTALYSIGRECMLMIAATTVVGFLLAAIFTKGKAARLQWLVFAVINAYLQWAVLLSNAVMYV